MSTTTGDLVTKHDREIVEILEAFDLAIRDNGGDPFERVRRPKVTDPFIDKIEELVDKSQGQIRADVVHRRLVAMGFAGNERSTRRAVALAKQAYRDGHRRSYKPWVPEPGLWIQLDWGKGPKVGTLDTQLFCAWLAWSRYRVVLPTWDQTLPTLLSCLDTTLRRIGGAPTYVLTDNPKTVTTEHIAGIAMRHPDIVSAGRHYGCKVETCVPYDPESKGGVESTVKIAKADLVPTTANLAAAYGSFAELADACFDWCQRVNDRVHRETQATPHSRLVAERQQLHILPAEPFLLALGEERLVHPQDQTIRWGSVRYSTPHGFQGQKVWCRVEGEELVVVARTEYGLAEIARHELSTPGSPRILDEHYPHHPAGNLPRPPKPRPRTAEEIAFLDLGEGAQRWLIEAGAHGAQRVRSKMRKAVELATVLGCDKIEQALGLAAIAGRFGDDDLVSILDHLATSGRPTDVVFADETHSVQPGTGPWDRFGS